MTATQTHDPPEQAEAPDDAEELELTTPDDGEVNEAILTLLGLLAVDRIAQVDRNASALRATLSRPSELPLDKLIMLRRSLQSAETMVTTLSTLLNVLTRAFPSVALFAELAAVADGVEVGE